MSFWSSLGSAVKDAKKDTKSDKYKKYKKEIEELEKQLQSKTKTNKKRSQ